MSDFFLHLSTIGEQKLAAASASGPLALSTVVIGDGTSELTPGITALPSERYRTTIDGEARDPARPNTIRVEYNMPAQASGFTYRQIAILDQDGDLIVYGDIRPIELPVAGDGLVYDVLGSVLLQFSDADSVQVLVDPSRAFATREYVDRETANFATQADLARLVHPIQDLWKFS